MLRRQPQSKSLWLAQTRGTVTVRLDRWANYPHFFETLQQYGQTLPEFVTVSRGGFSAFTKYGFDEEGDWDFVHDVASRMQAGEDIPPLVMENGNPSDGRHRAFAARELGLRSAPIIHIAK